MPDYSVIIPAYNEEALLPRTLSLLRHAMATSSLVGEVIVVDNNSNDRTAEVARESGATVVHEQVNQISRARNAGARSAHGRYFIFLDADTKPTAELLTAALSRLESGAAGGGAFIELAPDKGSTIAHRVLPVFSWVLMKLGICGGSFIFCRRDAFIDIGGFSEKVFAAEDVLFSRALRVWGRRKARSFDILSEPIRSSDRKIHTYSPMKLTFLFFMFIFFPFAVRFRSLCGLWYRRP